ncbi:ribosomal L27 protein-domain-containing protein [Bombardia bombarda]|uniref:Large ribosomal subunit protein bL27m n=1 Tax=Bombardia bombarda TaxID=252184 RepID=A0AA39U070_9PEZI|nr:ribosomal L27 protein-domain-containing protein [Bombardia bombarda]
MHLIQLRRPLQRAAASSCRPLATSLTDRFAQLSIANANANANANPNAEGRRYASVKSQGAYKLKPKNPIPKKLGAKKTGDQFVQPGNILYKQRGTIWHPGENAIIGRDHTIHAAATGYVKYYRDPQRHPKRQYIGVVFNKDDKLPYPVGAPRKRKFGFVAVPRRTDESVEPTLGPSGIPLSVTRHEEVETPVAETEAPTAATSETKPTSGAPVAAVTEAQTRASILPTKSLSPGNAILATLIKEKVQSRQDYEARMAALKAEKEAEMQARRGTRVLRLQDDYSYRESNWEIGRLVNDVGSVAGTEKTGSRKQKMRSRRRSNEYVKKAIKIRKYEKAARREQYQKFVAAKRELRTNARAEIAAKEKENIKAKLASQAAEKKVEA